MIWAALMKQLWYKLSDIEKSNKYQDFLYQY